MKYTDKNGMLVLTRRPHEYVLIGPNGEIEVTVLGVRGNQVKLGFKAPKNIPVHREEVYDRIEREKPDNFGNRIDNESINEAVCTEFHEVA